MNFAIALFPLLLVVLIPLIPILIFRRTASSSKKNISKWLLGGYFVILLLSVFVYEMLPAQHTNVKFVRADDIDEETQRFDQALFSGKTEDIDPAFIQDEWELVYEGKQIQIQLANHSDSLALILVERKQENDGRIEGTYYANMIMGGIDFTKEIMPIKAIIEGGRLVLVNSERESLKLSVLQKEFVITQFTGDRWLDHDRDPYRNIQFLYLRIPKDLEIDDLTGIGINYIEE